MSSSREVRYRPKALFSLSWVDSTSRVPQKGFYRFILVALVVGAVGAVGAVGVVGVVSMLSVFCVFIYVFLSI
jgi:hypothetical protein